MTWSTWLLAALGFLLGQAISGLVALDVWLALTGKTTISAHLLTAGLRNPVVPALVAGVVCLVIGALLGHLFWQQG